MRELLYIAFLVAVLLVGGCTRHPETSARSISGFQKDIETIDSACAYYHFLQAAFAESNMQYETALEAYEKNLQCDPEAEISKNKIPLILLGTGKKEEAVEHLTQLIKQYPETTSHKLLLADIHLQNKEFDKASLLYDQLRNESPDTENILLRIGTLNTQQGQYEQAILTFNELLQYNNELYYPHLYLARLHLHLKNYDKAEHHYSNALRINWSAELVHEFAAFYKVIHNEEAVLSIYEELIHHSPYDERAHFGIVSTLLTQKKEQKALDKLLQMRTFVAAPHTIDLIISKIYIAQNKRADAKAHLLHLFHTPAEEEGCFLLALLYAESNKLQALDYLAKIKNTFNDYDDALLLQYKLFTDLEQYDEAIQSFTERTMDEQQRSPTLFSILALLHGNKKTPDQALAALIHATEYYPDNDDILFDLALQYELNGKRDEALETMLKVLRNQPENADVLNFIGYLWADSDKNLDLALSYIEKAHSLQPDSAYILDSLGWVYFKRGDIKKAKSYLTRALELEKEDPHIYSHLGDVLLASGQTQQAKENYLKALKYAEDQKTTLELREKLNAL